MKCEYDPENVSQEQIKYVSLDYKERCEVEQCDTIPEFHLKKIFIQQPIEITISDHSTLNVLSALSNIPANNAEKVKF